MALPTVNDVHVSQPLTNISIAFMQEDPGIAATVFPIVPVKHQYDQYYTYDRGDFNRINVKKRAPGTESEGADYRLSSDTFACEPFALHKDIAFEERANADAVLDADMDATAFLAQQMKLKRDAVWAAEFFTTGVWTGSTTGTDITPSVKWDQASAIPIKDMRAQIRSVQKITGRKPNTLVLGCTTWDALQDCPDFLSRIQYTQTGIVTEDLLARVLGIQRVIVGELMQVTSQEGDATITTAHLFGEGALLMYVNPRPALRAPSAGYTFEWQVPGIPSFATKKFEMTHLNSDRIETQAFWDYKSPSFLLGAFLGDVLT